MNFPNFANISSFLVKLLLKDLFMSCSICIKDLIHAMLQIVSFQALKHMIILYG